MRKFLNFERVLTELRSEKFEWFGPSPIEPFNLGLGSGPTSSRSSATATLPSPKISTARKRSPSSRGPPGSTLASDFKCPDRGKGKGNFEVPFSRFPELFRARSRLYRSQILQVNTRWKALVEIYTMHSFAPFWNRIPKTRKNMGRKKPGPYNPRKTWPGEALKPPQLATQYYPRAKDKECLRIPFSWDPSG